MRKLLSLCLASLGPCIAPQVFADDEHVVTLYGRVYVTVESVEATGPAARPDEPPIARRARVSDQSSLLGVRGRERLGHGLTAFFQLETGFKPDENNTAFAARNSAVGMECRYGSVLLGRWDTPFKVATGTVDVFGDLTIGGLSAAMNGAGLFRVAASQQFDRRDTNVIQYWSPEVAGFSGRLSHAVNEARSAAANPRNSGASLVYRSGRFFAGYAYDEMRDATLDGVPRDKQAANALFGVGSFGPLRVGLLAERITRDGGFTPQKAFMGNVTWTIGALDLIYQYQQSRGGSDYRAPVTKILIEVPGEPRCNVHAIAVQYRMSPRSMVIAQYVRVENNAPALCNFGTNALDIQPGQDPRGAAVGMRHLF